MFGRQEEEEYNNNFLLSPANMKMMMLRCFIAIQSISADIDTVTDIYN